MDGGTLSNLMEAGPVEEQLLANITEQILLVK